MNAPGSDALGFCLLLSRAGARLERSMEERLGNFHGLSFADFSLLSWMAGAPDGRIAMTDLGPELGMNRSSAVRKIVQLEKIGLVQREGDTGGDASRCARLTVAGKRLVQEAEVTARAACTAAIAPIPIGHLREVERALAGLCQCETLATDGPHARSCTSENRAV